MSVRVRVGKSARSCIEVMHDNVPGGGQFKNNIIGVHGATRWRCSALGSSLC